MQRRQFLATAGIGAGAILAGQTGSATAAEKAAEKRMQVWKCEECGTVIEILEPGMPSLQHCGKPMKLLEEKTEGEGAVKHVPVVEKIEGGYKVKVGETAHPMLKAHYISFIELIADGQVMRQFLQVGAAPEATFMTDAKKVTARAECNLHGLWKA